MSKTFTSMDALKTAIQKEIRDAMTEVADQSLLNVHQNVDSFYAFGGGGQYQRTGQLAESPEVRLSGGGDNYNLQISLDTGFRYNPSGRDTMTIWFKDAMTKRYIRNISRSTKISLSVKNG